MISAPQRTSPIDLSWLKVMVVDDEVAVLHTVRDMLRSMGVQQVCLARDGAAAMDILDRGRQPVTVVVADWNMPGMNGIELFRAVRTHSPDLGFMLLTGRCDAESVIEAKNQGVDGYLKKPFSAAQLSAKLASVGYKLQTRTASPAA